MNANHRLSGHRPTAWRRGGVCSAMLRGSWILALAFVLVGCESDNEHFCARYQYLYEQLLRDDVPSYTEMYEQLQANLADPKKKKDQAEFMLFVLEDWRSGIIPEGEAARDFCMRVQRWQAYQPRFSDSEH